ncbi:MAG: lipoate-protein ligase A related protein [Planctomycetaceae bacterium]|nr:lipoate-protein ligase A related protein [Planctomycetaceae bacterium]|tara:strand:- start:1835 stop:2557 length:723 start_codon:yes stop_codon:yes gene_type:complete
MQLLDITLDSMIENIALDEALLLHCEQTGEQFLRFWNPRQHAVIMGRSGKLEQEAITEYCRANQIPVYRRPSGGGTILTGPGCLMYATVLNSNLNLQLKQIQGCHDFVLGEMVNALNQIGIPCGILGVSDLAIGNLKFSGNSLRLKRDSILYHGTLLCEFNLKRISNALLPPPKQPGYRENRTHIEFVTNLDRPVTEIKAAIIQYWKPVLSEGIMPERVQTLFDELMCSKYQDTNWNVLS